MQISSWFLLKGIQMTDFNEEKLQFFFLRIQWEMLKPIQLRIRFNHNSCLKRPTYIYEIRIFLFRFFLHIIAKQVVPKRIAQKDQNYAHNSDCKWNRSRLNRSLCHIFYMQIIFKYAKRNGENLNGNHAQNYFWMTLEDDGKHHVCVCVVETGVWLLQRFKWNTLAKRFVSY